MTLEELAQNQQTTGDEIRRLVSNYKKDTVSRKTLDYLNKRLQNLNLLWDNFEKIDNEIRIKYESRRDHPYFQKEYYEGIRAVYEDVHQDIIKRIKDLTITSNLTTTTNEPLKKGIDLQGSGANSKLAPNNNISNNGSLATPISKSDQGNAVHNQLMRALCNMLSNLTWTSQSPQYYQMKIDAINKHWNKIQSIYDKLVQNPEENAITEFNLEEYFNLEERMHNQLTLLYEKLHSSSSQTEISPQAVHMSTTTNQTNVMSPMKLPKLELPKFDGDYLKWRQYRDLFTELVHKQPIAACQKMWYLKGSISGEPEKLIRHLVTSQTNYSIAWQIITERYENTRLLVTALLNKLLNQSSITSESAAAIKALHDTTHECLLGLQNLDVNVEHWDPMLLHILIKKLDRQTHTLWEQSLKQPKNLQSMADFLKFLENRFQSLEALGPQKLNEKKSTQKSLTTAAKTNCPCCNDNHPLFSCSKFLQLSPHKRIQFVKKYKLCINCLKSGHGTLTCQSRSCTKCAKKHNTLLHLPTTINNNTLSNSNVNSNTNQNKSLTSQNHTKTEEKTSLSVNANGYVLLSTVVVKLTAENKSIECRAILDSGSQLNFVTTRIVKKLGLKRKSSTMKVEGIGSNTQKSEGRVNVFLESRINGFSTRLEAHILPHIISAQPAENFDVTSWPIPANIQLADPHFNISKRIDVLIGAELYYSLLSVGQIKIDQHLPTLQNTVFGWVVSGRIQAAPQTTASCGISTEEFGQSIEKLWALEDAITKTKQFTIAEQRCQTHFTQNTYRNEDGRFVVRLPFDEDAARLGESKDIALQRFFAIERKLSKNNEMKTEYIKFMDEYLRLDHMEEVDVNKIQHPYNFLPHHCVLKPDSTTTKLRVVFDASAKTSTNWSLNDILATGPTIQDDVFSILLRFRFPKYAFTADIEKMYRQIQVHSDDQKYQLIWWRKDMNENLKCFKLKTVTYGTTCAPFLATKCLETLAEESIAMYPLGATALKRDFYVDDLLTGADTLHEAMEVQRQLRLMLQSAGFYLRKWCANHPQLLSTIPFEDQEIQLNFNNKTEDKIKAVGLIWLPKSDELSINISSTNSNRITKRTVASDIARLFDPLGILMPVTVLAKIFIQKLWNHKCDWDAAIPQEMHTYWENFREQLKDISNIKIPRHIAGSKTPSSTQIHIFADASEKAYGAVAYVRTTHNDNTIIVRLLCAKSRVAPLKQITLPRLELCAAKMAAELAQRLQEDLNLANTRIHLWSDSEIVLAWINSTSAKYQTFVANRIATIQQLTIPQQWRHVGSKDNPADILSRGVNPSKLKQCHMWFYGPKFLHGAEKIWPPPYVKKSADLDVEKKQKIALTITEENTSSILHRITPTNSFRRTQRIIAYIMRFVNRVRQHVQPPKGTALTPAELYEAQIIIVRMMQQQELKEDYVTLERTGEVARNSTISHLTPFLDDKKVMRVGGRLENSELTFQAKHPMILPYTHRLTKCLLNDIHKENLHVGPQTLLAIARQTIWPMKGKILARSVLHNCVHCNKMKPKLMTQLMGNLPRDRVQPSRPFINSGVDFCGPIWTHFKIRGKKPQKSYIAVFCCFATKATHLEVVTDLSTQGFLGALRRFIARRGHCKTIYCDNATNFVGARNLLEVKDMLQSSQSQEQITTSCSSKGIEFHFIPPRAPHFGGLWEAAVKSAKHLLQKILASASLTYEELETAVTEVEAILNSRPITPLSSDPNDLTALTPGHFLIGEPLTSSVDTASQLNRADLTTRWKHISYIKNEFWKRWSSEYLNQLQHRYRWKQRCNNIQPNTLVLIKEDNVPSLKWPMGRIVNVIKGNDGLVRVADIRTSHGMIRRPIHRLSPLPIEPEKEEETELEPIATDKPPIESDEIVQPTSSKRERSLDDDHNNPRKKRQHSLGATLVALSIACLLPSTAMTSPIEVKPFKHQPGLYFENLGTANILANEWDLVVFYDMNSYWRELTFLQNSTRILEELCTKITTSHTCSEIISHLRNLEDEISRNNLLLDTNQHQNRKKRGAINVIGNIANALFGILDEEYAQKMSKTIQTVQQNEDHLLHLIKNQTTILDATLNIMKRDEGAVMQQFHQLNEQISKLDSKMGNELYLQQVAQAFDSISLLSVLTTTNFLRIQSAILNVLTDSRNGRINPLLISPLQLKQELNKINAHLPSSLRLPVSQTDIQDLYTIAAIEGRMTDQHIIFKIRIPLIASEDFELLKITPIPTYVNNTSYVVQPSSTFMVINLHRDHYYPLTDQELQSCIIIKNNRHLCKQKHPIYRKGSTISKCEVDLINNLSQSPDCHIVTTTDGPHWIQLYKPNQWIYVLQEKTTLNVVCDDTATQYTIEGSGILTIKNKCVIKQPLVTIQGHNVYPTNSRASFFPQRNITETLRFNTTTVKIHQVNYQTHINEIEAIKKELAQFKENLLPPLNHHDIHQYAVGYTSLGLITVILIAYAIWRFIRQPRTSTPVPRPRTVRHQNPVNEFNTSLDI